MIFFEISMGCLRQSVRERVSKKFAKGKKNWWWPLDYHNKTSRQPFFMLQCVNIPSSASSCAMLVLLTVSTSSCNWMMTFCDFYEKQVKTLSHFFWASHWLQLFLVNQRTMLPLFSSKFKCPHFLYHRIIDYQTFKSIDFSICADLMEWNWLFYCSNIKFCKKKLFRFWRLYLKILSKTAKKQFFNYLKGI